MVVDDDVSVPVNLRRGNRKTTRGAIAVEELPALHRRAALVGLAGTGKSEDWQDVANVVSRVMGLPSAGPDTREKATRPSGSASPTRSATFFRSRA